MTSWKSCHHHIFVYILVLGWHRVVIIPLKKISLSVLNVFLLLHVTQFCLLLGSPMSESKHFITVCERPCSTAFFLYLPTSMQHSHVQHQKNKAESVVLKTEVPLINTVMGSSPLSAYVNTNAVRYITTFRSATSVVRASVVFNLLKVKVCQRKHACAIISPRVSMATTVAALFLVF